MQFKPSLFLVGLVSAIATAAQAGTGAAGVIVPADLPDGFYVVHLDAGAGAGGVVTNASAFEPLDVSSLVAAPARKRESSRPLARRRTTYSSKGATGSTFASWMQNDYNTCTNVWRDFFLGGGGVPPRSVYVYTQGDAVLAGCNYLIYDFINKDTNPTLVDYFNGIADNAWGWWTTGWVNFQWRTIDDFTLWRDIRGTAICTNL